MVPQLIANRVGNGNEIVRLGDRDLQRCGERFGDVRFEELGMCDRQQVVHDDSDMSSAMPCASHRRPGVCVPPGVEQDQCVPFARHDQNAFPRPTQVRDLPHQRPRIEQFAKSRADSPQHPQRSTLFPLLVGRQPSRHPPLPDRARAARTGLPGKGQEPIPCPYDRKAFDPGLQAGRGTAVGHVPHDPLNARIPVREVGAGAL